MIFNYLKIAVRNLLKYKFISFNNLFGLTVGLACCLLILTYIIHELSYEKYHDKADRIYRVTRLFKNGETGVTSLHLNTVSPPFGPLLVNDFKEIEKLTRTLQNNTVPFRYEDKIFNELNSYWADSNFFHFFKVDVVKGNPSRALTDPYSVMLEESIARKYFGTADPVDKVIRMNNQFDFKVTGTYKAFPTNTHFHPELMLSFSTLRDTAIYGEERLRTNWGNNSFFTYAMLTPGYDAKKLEAQFPAFIDRHMPKGSHFKPSKTTELFLQRLTDIHLRSHLDSEAEQNGDIKRVYIFSAIALFILLIACINYMNLSTARSALRAREIGVRKVVGAERKSIILQFLTESVFVCWLAIILAFVTTWLVIPLLNQISGASLSIDVLLRWQVMVPLIIIPFIVGILSGLYPAIFMSSFQPIMVLKGLFRAGGGNISFRKVLVTAQFAISIILIVSTAVVFKQMRFMQNKELGFDREHIVTLPYTSALNDQYDAFRTALLQESALKDVGRSSRIPTGRLLDAMGSQMKNGDTLAPANVDIKYVAADHDFTSTYGIKMVAGRPFSRDFSLDTSAFLINESAASILGFKRPEDAVGKDFGYGNRRGKLIGVFHDFHFESLHQKIVPLVLLVPRSANNFGNISVKIAGSNLTGALAHIEKTWHKFLPEVPYQYTFMDDNFTRLYEAEQREKNIFTIFAFIAIFIACLGLLGLSAFTISQRVKEIGIRKVLGADVSTIVTLLSKDFMKLVIISAIIAFPVAWWAMNSWLQDFAYRISIPWWIFLLAGIVAALIALATISFQAVRAALANPVKSLRTE
ncbi:MAG: ABC transporter permease [Chitinophagaceae bacterium]|nr:ABC transporter permease [Chitinophagaceae bacterium]